MLGLIMVAGMVPGLLIGLQRTTAIDYDAVAYRTGAILAEDPGWPVFPAWELSNNADGVDRIGLAVAKESPNILSMAKIEKFCDSGIFPSSEEYRKRVIFGDYPYRFNISLKNDSGILCQPSANTPIPDLGSYGYIQRIIKIKEPARAIIDLNQNYAYQYNFTDLNATSYQNFTIRLNLSELVDKSINPAYQYDPRVEPIDISIINFSAKLNNSQYYFNGTPLFPLDYPTVASVANWTDQSLTPPNNATLTKIRFYKNENPSALPFDYENQDPLKYRLSIEDESHNWIQNNLSPSNQPVFNNLTLYIAPGTLPLDEGTTLDIRFTFFDTYNSTDLTPVPRTLINGTHILNYTRIEQSPLQNGWLEVAVW